jgi:glycerophosphoryl diester phosphodiesterase
LDNDGDSGQCWMDVPMHVTPASRSSVLALVGLALLAGCARRDLAWRAVRPQAGRPLVVAHRGASGSAPENTLAAFREAMAHGARAIECDVHLSADGAVVVIHDATLERTTDGQGRVAEQRLTVLKTLDAGRWMAPAFAGERIPELSELLDLVDERLLLFIELKAGDRLAERVAAVLGARGGGNVVLLSFDPEQLVHVKRLLPGVPTMLLARREAQEAPAWIVDTAVAARAMVVGVERGGLDAAFVEAAHRAGLGVFAWTVNSVEEARRLAALGVDGLVTDHPARIEAALAQP